MARPAGNKNADYDEVKAKLLQTIRGRLLRTGSDQVSFREMAEYAGVSVPTLRHYFGTRTVLVEQVFADLHKDGLRYLQDARTSHRSFEASMQEAADAVLAAARFGRMDKVHTLGLTEGLNHPELGPAYLDHILEPSLQAIEARLEAHRLRGQCNASATRHAALAFAAPLILAILHQKGLGGECTRPLDLGAFARDHVQAFVAAYRRPSVQHGKKGTT